MWEEEIEAQVSKLAESPMQELCKALLDNRVFLALLAIKRKNEEGKGKGEPIK